MAHSADDGRDACGNRAGYRFFVEAPEVLQRAAATGLVQGMEELDVLISIV
jgi:hypothetical protein